MDGPTSIPPPRSTAFEKSRIPILSRTAIAASIVWMVVIWIAGNLLGDLIDHQHLGAAFGLQLSNVWSTGMIIGVSFWAFWLTDFRSPRWANLVAKIFVTSAAWKLMSLGSIRSSWLVAADLMLIVSMGYVARFWFEVPVWRRRGEAAATAIQKPRQFGISAVMLATFLVAAVATVVRNFTSTNGAYYWVGEIANVIVMAVAAAAIFKASLARKAWRAACWAGLWAACLPIGVAGSYWFSVENQQDQEMSMLIGLAYLILYGGFHISTLVLALATYVQSFESEHPATSEHSQTPEHSHPSKPASQSIPQDPASLS